MVDPFNNRHSSGQPLARLIRVRSRFVLSVRLSHCRLMPASLWAMNDRRMVERTMPLAGQAPSRQSREGKTMEYLRNRCFFI
jgi:hypothetical protein